MCTSVCLSSCIHPKRYITIVIHPCIKYVVVTPKYISVVVLLLGELLFLNVSEPGNERESPMIGLTSVMISSSNNTWCWILKTLMTRIMQDLDMACHNSAITSLTDLERYGKSCNLLSQYSV